MSEEESVTRLNMFFASLVLTLVLVFAGVAPAVAAPSANAVGPPAAAGPPDGAGPSSVPPTPVCNPSWGSIVIPICV
jgi:hypothetical protein